MKMSINTTGRLLFAIFLGAVLIVASRSGYAERDAQAPSQQPAAAQPAQPACPGQAMGVQATGVYTPKPVPDITINGQPAPGAIWQPGMRSYWHCHTGGQIMMLDDGVGRVQKRGERVRTLHRGDTEYAPPGVEHWH